jgi:hypothetical protein
MKTHVMDRFFWRNTAGISGTEVFWGIALPVIVESTFLQVFLGSIGAGSGMIGAIPSLFALCIAIFAPLSSFLTSHLKHKKRAVILFHALSAVPVVLYGVLLPLLPGGGLWFFFVSYFAISAVIGMTLPLWQNFTVNVFSPRMAMKGLSVMYIVQTAFRVLGGVLIMLIIRKYTIATDTASLIFIGAGLFLFAGSFSFLAVKEEPSGDTKDSAHTLRTFVAAARDILRNRSFTLFALSSVEGITCITAMSFMAHFAVAHRSVPEAAAAGLLSAAVSTGSVAGSILFGWLNFGSIKTKYAASKVLTITGVALVIAGHSLSVFVAAALLFGVARGIYMIAFSPAVKRLSGREDATDYFSVFPVLVLPFSSGLPLAAGKLVERFAQTEAAYVVMFAVLGGITLLTYAALLPLSFGSKRLS